MKKLYLFNPDNDMALANNDENYMPPKAAKQLEIDLALLPIWYAEPEAMILANSYPNTTYLEQLKSIFPISSQVVTFPEIPILNDFEFSPWGWNRALLKRMQASGCSEKALYNKDAIDSIRLLSKRTTAVNVLSNMPLSHDMCGRSSVIHSIEELHILGKQYGSFLLKSPLSSSGKGLKWCRAGIDEAAIKWCSNILKSQKVVIIEPIYSKVKDFAMEFRYSDVEGVVFVGYSSFKTSSNGSYIGNELISDELFEHKINSLFRECNNILERVRGLLLPQLQQIVSRGYKGYFGVDMMVCKFNSEPYYRLHPCVEINLRMNMGLVAHSIYKNFLQLDRTGIYQIDYAKDSSIIHRRHKELAEQYPLVVKNGRIESGYLALNALSNESQYLAWVLIE